MKTCITDLWQKISSTENGSWDAWNYNSEKAGSLNPAKLDSAPVFLVDIQIQGILQMIFFSVLGALVTTMSSEPSVSQCSFCTPVPTLLSVFHAGLVRSDLEYLYSLLEFPWSFYAKGIVEIEVTFSNETCMMILWYSETWFPSTYIRSQLKRRNQVLTCVLTTRSTYNSEMLLLTKN